MEQGKAISQEECVSCGPGFDGVDEDIEHSIVGKYDKDYEEGFPERSDFVAEE